MNNYTVSEKGIVFIKKHEGCVLHAYRDSGGILTIGVGHTGLVRGQAITGATVITSLEAEALLKTDLVVAQKAIANWVSVPLKQVQYDALCSFIFNCGINAFKGSSLLRKLNLHEYNDASLELLKWCKVGGKTDSGLLNRRKAEQLLFTKGIYN
jgi:lysozyme